MDTIAYTIVCGIGPRVRGGMSREPREARGHRRRAVGGLAAAAYAAELLAAARVRRLPDADAARALDAPIHVDRRLDTHDGGSLYVVEAGDESLPPIVLSHGVTLSVRTWF
jgi:hypothetical protein